MIKINIKACITVLLVFCGIFAPPFFRFNFLFVLTAIALAFFLLHPNLTKRKFKKMFSKNSLGCILLFYGLFLVNILCNMAFGDIGLNGNRIGVLYQWLLLIPMQVIISVFIVCYMGKQFNMQNAYQALIYAGGLQGVFSLLAFCSPQIRSFFMSIIQRKKGIGNVYENEYIMSYRGYGFASTLVDTFGYGMGLICGIILLTALFQLWKNKGILAIGVFSIALNSRTGFIMLLIAIVLSVLKRKPMKHRITGTRAVFAVLAPPSLLAILLAGWESIARAIANIQKERTFQWIMGGFSSVFNFITGTEARYRLGSMQNTLFDKSFWILPSKPWSLLFGEGHTIYGTRDYLGIASDVGYVNYIWTMGFVGTGFFFLLVLILLYKCCQKVTHENRIVILYLGISFFIMLIKGNVMSHTPGTFVTIFVLVCALMGDRQNESNNKCIDERLQ